MSTAAAAGGCGVSAARSADADAAAFAAADAFPAAESRPPSSLKEARDNRTGVDLHATCFGAAHRAVVAAALIAHLISAPPGPARDKSRRLTSVREGFEDLLGIPS